ncbi:uncharacterized protein LOC131005501 [Salvia miltiorrhiza]|uniref:uncharacterized protein LOC131005501 n=1 Tax=Salvia miltiorrhiza TaxID=226208 RepID=UPI0025AC037B|nr:uncharacterized protein LOC131005501 [Salvia miltiorrhiza]XP_057788488.1 uncharacterized protein LOC131005501 [Salvia miltiorrhiza]XP_057788489.1 uncharacterized protein LOC131005501 [Salvia miltiorrhiza]
MLSPEDAAWVDSCLRKDLDMLEDGWNSLKDTLFVALNAQHDPSPYEREDSPERANMDVVSDEDPGAVIDNLEEETVNGIAVAAGGVGADSGLQIQSPRYDFDKTLLPSRYDFDKTLLPRLSKLMQIHYSRGRNDIHNSEITPLSIADTSDRAEPSSDGVSNHEDVDADPFWSKHKMEDIFLPTYDEKLKDLRLSDPEVDFVFQESKSEQSTDDIFKIWDLDGTPEENDLVNQLNRALAGNPAPPFLDDSGAGSVDDLVSGIADLSLSQTWTKTN